MYVFITCLVKRDPKHPYIYLIVPEICKRCLQSSKSHNLSLNIMMENHLKGENNIDLVSFIVILGIARSIKVISTYKFVVHYLSFYRHILS